MLYLALALRNSTNWMGNVTSDVSSGEVSQSEPSIWDRLSNIAADLSNRNESCCAQER